MLSSLSELYSIFVPHLMRYLFIYLFFTNRDRPVEDSDNCIRQFAKEGSEAIIPAGARHIIPTLLKLTNT